MIISAERNRSEVNIDIAQVIDLLGPKGVVVVLAVGAFLLYRMARGLGLTGRRGNRVYLADPKSRGRFTRWIGRQIARAVRGIIRFVTLTSWAARMRMPLRLALRLQPERWRAMCEARKLVGLKRGKVKRTPMGVDVRVTLGGALTLETLTARIRDLETGLGTRRGAIRVEPTDMANKAIVRITVRNPLARPVQWIEPPAPVSIKDLTRVSMNPFGEWTEIDLRQRILIVGASGSGKSSVQRVLAAPVILAADADLEVWDLKQGTESQHYEGKADVRITTAEQAKARLDWYMESELPRRAAVMQKLKTSTWPTSAQNPDRIIMVDETAALVRELDEEELARFFTFLEQIRAFGIYLWLATQFPKSSNLPTELRSQMSAVVALKMRRSSESRVVFEDLTKEGWTPHRLPGKGWLMLLDDDHQDPEESRAAWLDETRFRKLQPYVSSRPAAEIPPLAEDAPAIPAGVVPPMPTYAPTIPAQRTAAELDVDIDQAVNLTKESAVSPPPDAGELPVTDAVMTALADAPAGGMSAAQLQLTTGRGKSQVYAALQELQDDGRAVKVGHGRYALPATGEVSA